MRLRPSVRLAIGGGRGARMRMSRKMETKPESSRLPRLFAPVALSASWGPRYKPYNLNFSCGAGRRPPAPRAATSATRTAVARRSQLQPDTSGHTNERPLGGGVSSTERARAGSPSTRAALPEACSAAPWHQREGDGLRADACARCEPGAACGQRAASLSARVSHAGSGRIGAARALSTISGGSS